MVCEFFCPEPDGDGVVAYDSAPDHTDVVAVTSWRRRHLDRGESAGCGRIPGGRGARLAAGRRR
ncbi:hypothetical protein AB0C29_43150, partial [Actinoplanes sp. NPDC048791]|uniref:hypothetical protein n=1 Tax=Actinoplanes sp. NPDC048791 TaxID=3154623 RepID=UPI0033D4A61A